MYPKKFLWLLYAALMLTQSAWAEQINNVITLDSAIANALRHSPRLVSAQSALDASTAELTQSGLWQNPEIGIEVENFAGGGNYKGIDGAEVTYGVSQLIEIGGKRSARQLVAQQAVTLAGYEQSAERLNVIRDASVAYANAVAAQEMLKLATEQKGLAASLFSEVTKRVNAAREPLVQKSKAEITISTSNFAHERAERELEHAKHVLSNMWAEHDDDFQLQTKDFFKTSKPITETEAETIMETNPSLKLMEAGIVKTQAALELEKAQAIPDPRVNVGIRDLRGDGEQAFVAGLSIPFPVLNQNEGNIERARHESIKAESDKEVTKLAMVNELHEALENQINAYRNAENLKDNTLPSAEEAFRLSRQGYGLGKFPYLEVLDAQRTLFEVKEQYITALKDYHIAKAEVERLTARHINTNETEEVTYEK